LTRRRRAGQNRNVKFATRKVVPACILLCALLLPFPASAECKRAALDLPVTISGTRALIPAKINGQDVRFLVDSGASYSMISSAAAAEYKLKVGMGPFGLAVRGIGGTTTPQLATVHVFTLADFDLHNVEFLVGGSETGSGSAGLLGQNFLLQWNVDYDLAKGMIRLFKDTDCRKQFLAYWVAKEQLPYTVTNIEKVAPRQPLAIAHAYINGEKIRVIFDSGAFRSILSVKAAARAGVKIDSPGVVDGGMTGGIGRGMVKSYIAPFASFKFADGEEIKNARLRVADIDLEIADMLIGADFFLSHHIFIANGQDKLYFTYNGGPVFDLRTAPAKAESSARASDSAADSSPAAEANAAAETRPPEAAAAPEDAAALARRGTASEGRNDYDHALADLTRAVELDPNNADYLYERGRVYLWKKDRDKALADFSKVLELKPDDVRALMSRAQLRIGEKDVPDARVDLEAVDRVAAKQADIRYQLAEAYERADLLFLSIAQLDLWIDSHPDDRRIAYALNGRCMARGFLGQELPAALKDCNTAVSRSGKQVSASVLDNRALVRYRLGDYDKAITDYDGALKLQPHSAWTLYGRGLAKLKKNQRTEGDQDIADAVKVAPGVADGYKKMGLSP
jgi:tetratricopeptide (TPR) repeat protein/predicted aspartyl protease